MSLKTSFKSTDARKRFINKMDEKWERKYKYQLSKLPVDEGFKFFEYLED